MVLGAFAATLLLSLEGHQSAENGRSHLCRQELLVFAGRPRRDSRNFRSPVLACIVTCLFVFRNVFAKSNRPAVLFFIHIAKQLNLFPTSRWLQEYLPLDISIVTHEHSNNHNNGIQLDKDGVAFAASGRFCTGPVQPIFRADVWRRSYTATRSSERRKR